MHADIKGALRRLNTAWRAFYHKGRPLAVHEVEAVLQHGLEKGYTSTSQLTDEEVDAVLAALNTTTP